MMGIIPNVKEEKKNIKDNLKELNNAKKGIVGWISRNPNAFAVISIIVIILIVLLIFSFFKVPFTNIKLSFVSVVPATSTFNNTILESVLAIENKGQDWKINKTYDLKWSIKTGKDFFGHIIIYFRPALENGLRTPVVYVEDSDKDKTFEANKSGEIKAKIVTNDSSEGRYNICILLTDNKEGSTYKYEQCNEQQIPISINN